MQKRAEGIQTGPRELSADPEAIQRRLQPDHIAEGESETSPQLSSISAQANSPEETPARKRRGSEPVELAKPARSVNIRLMRPASRMQKRTPEGKFRSLMI